MSWLGGSLSSLTGQLSNLTKDILTEGTEEVSDPATELRLAQEKIKEYDSLCNSQRIENERLRFIIRDLEEKSESSELQINSISREYRTLLEEKEKEVKSLKQKQHELLEHQLTPSLTDQSTPTHDDSTTGIFGTGSLAGGYQQDELDFGDNISMQHEINQLRTELQRSQAQCRHWKTLASEKDDTDSQDGHSSGSAKGDDSELERKVQELQQQLLHEKEQRHHELASLQDSYSEKMSNLRRKHREEVADLKRQLETLEDQITSVEDSTGDGSPEAEGNQRGRIKNLQDEILALQTERETHLADIATLNNKLQDQETELSLSHNRVTHLEEQLQQVMEQKIKLQEDYDQVGRELYEAKERLLDQLDANHADALEILGDLREVRHQMDAETIGRRNKLLEDKENLILEMIAVGQKQRELKSDVKELESSQRDAAQELTDMVEDIGNKEHQAVTSEIIDTVEKENLLLKKRNVELQEQVTLLERAVQSLTTERQQCEVVINSLRKQHKQQHDGGDGDAELSDNASDSTSVISNLSEMSHRNQELDKHVTVLQSQISNYETEIEQFELMKSDWQMEKEALEDVLLQLREQLKQKEMSLTVIQAQKGLAEAVKRDKCNKKKVNRNAKGLLEVERHEHEHDTGMVNKAGADDTDESDDSEANDGDIAADIEKLDQQVELLTEANEDLEIERDTLLIEKENLQKELAVMRSEEELRPTVVKEVTAAQPGPEVNETMASLEDQLKVKDKELDCVASENSTLKDEVSKLEQTVQEKSESLIQIQNRMAQCETDLEEVTDLRSKVKDQEEELKDLVVLRSKVKTQEEELKELISLRSLAKDQEEELKELICLRSKVKDYQEEMKEFTSLRSEVKGQEEELENLRIEKEELEAELEQVSDVKVKLKSAEEKLSSVKFEKEEMESTLSELEGLKEDFEKQRERVLELEKEKELTEVELKEVNNLQEIIQTQEEKILKLSGGRENSGNEGNEMKKLMDKVKGMEEEIITLSTEKGELEAGLEELDSQHQQAMEHVISMKDKLVKSNEELSQKLAQAEERIQELESRAGSDHAASAESEGNKEKEVKELQRRLSEVQEINESLKIQLGEWQSANAEVVELKEKLLSAKQEIESMKTEFSKLERQHQVSQSEETSTSNELNHQIADLQEQNKGLQKDLMEKDGRISLLQKEVEKYESEMKENKEKLLTAASALNDLHMDKQDLEADIKKYKDKTADKVSKIKELREELTVCKQENSELSARLQRSESRNESLQQSIRSEESRADLDRQVVELNEKLNVLRQQYQDVQFNLREKDKHIEMLTETRTSLEEEVVKLKSEIQNLNTQCDKVRIESEVQLSSSAQEFQSQLDSVRTEKELIAKETEQLENKFKNQTKHYENYIQELQKSKDMDSSALEKKCSDLVESNHKKDLHISEMEAQVDSLQTQLDDTKDLLQSTLNNHQQVSDLLQEGQTEMETMKLDRTKLGEEVSSLQVKLGHSEECFKSVDEKLQHSIQTITEQQNMIDRLESEKSESDRVQKENERTFDVITDLENQLSSARDKIVQLEEEVVRLQGVVKNHEDGIAHLNERHSKDCRLIQEGQDKVQQQEGMIEVIRQNSIQKDQEISFLQQKLQRAKSFVGEDQQKVIDSINEETISPNFNLPSLEYKEKGAIELVEVTECVQPLGSENKIPVIKSRKDRDSFDDNETNMDVLKELDELRKRISEKDDVISELQKNNSSLLKMLDKRPTGQGDKAVVDVHRLENELKSLKLEKEQMMEVMNEKSRESSNLRSEVHRLMNVVAAEKAALQKLQQDNQELINIRESSPVRDDGMQMQKEALQNLSRIIRDKDLEIESLTQKNQTLVAVLQESSANNTPVQNGSQINTLLQDKENLMKQLGALQSEREQMISYLNQKHQESLTYHNEVQRLTAFLGTENDKFERMKQDYDKIVPQFEDKKQALLKAQNELLNYKQKYMELEVKYGEMVQRSNAEQTVDKTLYTSKVEEAQRLQERYKELTDSLQEREQKIQSLHQNVNELEGSLSSKESERSSLQKQQDHLTFQLQSLQTEISDLRSESSTLQIQKQELASEIQVLKEMNNKLTLQLQERDFEVRSLGEKSARLTAVLQEQQGEKGELEHLMQESEVANKNVRNAQQERDQAILALKQKQAQNEDLRKEVQRLQEKEMKLNRELDRLRQHLIEIEDGYTREAIASEEREKELRNRLAVTEDNLLSSRSAVESASQHSNQQLENLQQQLHVMAQQRDQAYLQLASLMEQNQQYSTSMTNLQLVLEQFQQEKENLVAMETERYQNEVKSLKEQVNTLTSQLEKTKVELAEASDGLEAAARLSEQLDRKEEALAALKEEVQLRENGLKVAEEEIRKLTTNTEAKVDKLVIKNLLLGYFTTEQNKKGDVLHTIGGVLGFTPDDFHKVEHAGDRAWVPGFLRFGGGGGKKVLTPPTTPIRTVQKPQFRERSFSEMFVSFLERESSPPPPTVRMPAEEMARDVQKHKETHKPAYNPFTAPRHVAMPVQVADSSQKSHDSHILMGSVAMSQTLPTLTTMPASESSLTPPGSGRSTPAGATTSSAILKDVLNAR